MDSFLSEGVSDVIRCLNLVLLLFLVVHVMMQPRHKHHHKVYHVSSEGLASGPVDYSWGGNTRFMSESTSASTSRGQEGLIGAPPARKSRSVVPNIPHGPAKIGLGSTSGFVGGWEAPAFWGPTGGQALAQYNSANARASEDDNAAYQANQALSKASAEGMNDRELSLALNGR